jgi:hypothetical protein
MLPLHGDVVVRDNKRRSYVLRERLRSTANLFADQLQRVLGVHESLVVLLDR